MGYLQPMADSESHAETASLELLEHLTRMPYGLADAGGNVRLKDQLGFDRSAAAPDPPGTLELLINRKALRVVKSLVCDQGVEDPFDLEDAWLPRGLIP